jgi:beta-N-acetylglucosaminidase
MKINLKDVIVSILCICIIICGFSLYSRLDAFEQRVSNIETRIQKTHDAQIKLLTELEKLNESVSSMENHKGAINDIKNDEITVHTDLNVGDRVALNADDINRIIDGWSEFLAEDSVLKGHGEAFIVASRETGLDPVYLLAHAIVESGCGTSYLARERNNFFGINAVDSNPNLAYDMGDEVDEGIISGACWIKDNFYDNGYTSLYAMSNGGYASNPKWASDIVSVYNDAIELL